MRSVKAGSAWYLTPLLGMCGLKDAWYPFMATTTYMFNHWWILPTGWGLSIVAHWFILDQETFRQRRQLEAIRAKAKGKGRKR